MAVLHFVVYKSADSQGVLLNHSTVRPTAMRISQSKDVTKEFIALLESHLKTIHPNYQRNPKVKGIRHEYYREIEDGLFAVHSVICIRATFHHCFCLSLHRTHPSPLLYSPFTVGGRSDHNYAITKACHIDIGLNPVDPLSPFRMSDSHQFRSGSDRIVRRCTSEAEARLLPFYQSVWTKAKPALQALVDYYITTSADHLAEAASAYNGSRHELSCHMMDFQRLHSSLTPTQRSSFFAATILTIPDVICDIATRAQL